MAKEIQQQVVGITREDEIIVKSARGRIYPVKKGEGLEFNNDDLFKNVEIELYATIDTEEQPWVVVKIE